MRNRFGWILVKDKFWEAYETNRLIEEFQKQDIEIQLIDPNTIDIFVNKENKSSILVNGEPSDLPEQVVEQHITLKRLLDTLKEWECL